jgi:cytoskeleton protein RodZ
MAQHKRFLRSRPQEHAESDEFSYQRESVGELLSRHREELGYDLRGVSQVLRIRFVHLQAIESGDYEELPGVPYAVGFVRTYADYLGLDSAAVVAQFKEEISGLQRQKLLVFPEPKAESRVPGGAIILISVLLVILAYGGWYVLSEEERSWVELLPSFSEEEAEEVAAVPTVPEPKPASAGESTEQAAVAPASESPASEPAAPASEEPAEAVAAAPEDAAADSEPVAATEAGDVVVLPTPPENEAASAESVTVEAEATAPQSAEIPAAPGTEEATIATGGRVPNAYGKLNEDARIVLRATSDSWVQVRDPDDGVLFSRVLQPGDSYQVPNRADLVLLTGNAGGLDVLVDGQASPQLGPRGAVRRNVVLDPERLLAGTAVD